MEQNTFFIILRAEEDVLERSAENVCTYTIEDGGDSKSSGLPPNDELQPTGADLDKAQTSWYKYILTSANSIREEGNL